MDERRRGLGAAMYSVLHSVGFCMVLFLGAFLPWRIVTLVPLVISIPTFVAILFLQESPEWLKKKGRVEEYEKSLMFYQKYEVSTFSLQSILTISIFLNFNRDG